MEKALLIIVLLIWLLVPVVALAVILTITLDFNTQRTKTAHYLNRNSQNHPNRTHLLQIVRIHYRL